MSFDLISFSKFVFLKQNNLFTFLQKLDILNFVKINAALNISSRRK